MNKIARYKNIINKSKSVGSKPTSYDLFVNSLPKELDYFKDKNNYRLKAAWESYGRPNNLQEAYFNGLVDIIGDKAVMPSIGFNEETGNYEYLNTGKENDIVNRDIRVWENETIPFVKELKNGGYIRTFDEELNCWMYLKGGKTSIKRERKFKTYDELKEYLGERGSDENYDLESAYNDDDVYFNWENEEEKNPGHGHWSDKYKRPTHPTFSNESIYSNSVTPGGTWKQDLNGNWIFTTSPWIESQHSLEDLRQYFLNNEPGITLVYKNVPYVTPQAFKHGGQLNVIPEGSLHARKNNMELAKEGMITAKGIPVVDNEGNQTAEVEKEEITFTKSVTEKLEDLYKKFYDEDTSDKEKDELAIKCGKFLTKEILFNTDDRVGLIDKLKSELG